MEQAEVSVATGRRKEPPTVFIPQPQSVEETGLHSGLLLDLCIKCIYFAGRPPARQISSHMALPFPVIEELLDFLKREQYVEVVGSGGAGESQYKYALTVKGMEKAEEVLRRGQYNGPAPVAFEQYVEVQRRQSVRDLRIDKESERRELSHLVLEETALDALGAAVNSTGWGAWSVMLIRRSPASTVKSSMVRLATSTMSTVANERAFCPDSMRVRSSRSKISLRMPSRRMRLRSIMGRRSGGSSCCRIFK